MANSGNRPDDEMDDGSLDWGAALIDPERDGHTEATTMAAQSTAGDDDDPVSSLFKHDQTLPAPQISEQSSRGEVSRWQAAPSSSLFEGEVKDPPRQSPLPAAPAANMESSGLELDVPKAPGAARRKPPALLDTDLATAPTMYGAPAPTLLGMAPPPPGANRPPAPPGGPRRAATPAALPDLPALPELPDAPKQARRPAPPPAKVVADEPARQPAPPARKAKRQGPPKKGARPAKPKPPAARASDAGESAATTSTQRLPRRNVAKSRRNALLVGLGVLTVGVLTAVAMLLGIIPGPLGSATARIERVHRPAAPAAAVQTAPASPPGSTETAETKSEAEPAKGLPAEATAPGASPVKAANKPAEAKAPPAAAQPAEQEGEEDLDERRVLLAANQWLAEDEAEKAEALVRRLLAKDPRNHHALEMLARALIDQDRGKEAVEVARQAVAKRKKRARYRVLLGDALLMTGDQAAAQAQWREALKLEPNDKDVKQRLGL